ncbi:MAG: type II secretion system F family protein [Candidatus Hydrogenedentes bacterium]|nr:type II secretion system F family protein [Candidatus Hydrogenedentota bacterium]
MAWKRDPATQKVPHRVVEEFVRQLSSLLAAGVSLSRALSILHREASVPAAKTQWKAIHDAVVDGTSLASAMAKHPQTFPRVYTAMVQAGETGGFLATVLDQIAEFQSRSRDMKGKVLSAMIYPLVLLGLAIAVIIFLMLFFIPRFKVVFAGFGAQLPLITRAIVACSESLTHYGIYAAVGLAAAAWWAHHWIKTEHGSRVWQRWVLRFPVAGALLAQFAMARFCRMLGTLLEAGVPLISALRVGCDSLGNQTLADALTESIDRVKKGSGLAASLRDCKSIFPSTVLEMISVAEETGRLDKELMRLAAVTESDLDRRLRTAVSLVEPLLLFGMAGFIGTIFIGMVLPIFSLQDYIK